MQGKRQIRGRDFINDIRSGMTVLELIKKYRISSQGLRRILRKILAVDAMSKVEFAELPNLYEDASDLKDIRQAPRKRMTDPVWLFDNGNPFLKGRLLDVSDTGVCVEGIKTRIGEVKTFIVRVGLSGRNSSFVFEGTCRWVRRETQPRENFVAGFEITSISTRDQRLLQELLG